MRAVEFYDLHIYKSEAPVLIQASRWDDPIVDASLVRAGSLAVVASIRSGRWVSLCGFSSVSWAKCGRRFIVHLPSRVSSCSQYVPGDVLDIRCFLSWRDYLPDGYFGYFLVLHATCRSCVWDSLWQPSSRGSLVTGIVSWSSWRRQRFMATDCQRGSCVELLVLLLLWLCRAKSASPGWSRTSAAQWQEYRRRMMRIGSPSCMRVPFCPLRQSLSCLWWRQQDANRSGEAIRSRL